MTVGVPSHVPFKDLFYDCSGAAKGAFPGKRDPHNFRRKPPFFKFLFEDFGIEALVIAEGNDVGFDLLKGFEHIVFTAEEGSVYCPERTYHFQSLLFGHDRFWLVGHVGVPGNNDIELISQFPGPA